MLAESPRHQGSNPPICRLLNHRHGVARRCPQPVILILGSVGSNTAHGRRRESAGRIDDSADTGRPSQSGAGATRSDCDHAGDRSYLQPPRADGSRPSPISTITAVRVVRRMAPSHGGQGYPVPESAATRANVTVGGITRIATVATRQPAAPHGRSRRSRSRRAVHQVWVDADAGNG
jgi:hypothetical protein